MPPPSIGDTQRFLLATALLLPPRLCRWTALMNRSGEAFSMVGEAIEADHQRRALAGSAKAAQGCP